MVIFRYTQNGLKSRVLQHEHSLFQSLLRLLLQSISYNILPHAAKLLATPYTLPQHSILGFKKSIYMTAPSTVTLAYK